MSEQQVKAFGAHAESLVEIPEFATLDRRGHELRVRRRVGVAGALAMVLAVVGVLTQVHRTPAHHDPIKPPQLRSDARPYHGNMRTLDEGDYWLRPSLLDRHLGVRFTVPEGWNGWIGPNRFNGHAPGRSNSEALGHMTWYAGALVMEVDQVRTHGCQPDVAPLETPKDVVGALAKTYPATLLRGPEPVRRFGHAATYMRLRMKAVPCPEDGEAIFHATADGYIQSAPPGTLLDVWVVDVDGRPIYVQRAWTPDAPRHVRRELTSIVNSIGFGTV